MGALLAQVRRAVCLAGAAGVMALTAQAQDGGQPILFYIPGGTNGPAGLMQPAQTAADLANAIHAPHSMSQNSSAGSVAPPPPVQPPVPASSRDEDWALMTPAEILGVATTPGQILKGSHGGAGKASQSLTPMQRYTARQIQAENQTAALAARASLSTVGTNGGPSGNGPTFRQPDTAGALLGSSPLWSHFINTAPANADNPLGGPWSNAGGLRWSGDSASQTASPGALQPAAQANLDRLQQLLAPSAASPAASALAPEATAFVAPAPARSSAFDPSAFNLPGASITPLPSSLGTLDSLPSPSGIARPNTSQSPPVFSQARPVPPWEMRGPQPFVIPQRKF